MPNQDYLDFELNIEAISNTQLRITVNDSPVGSVSVEVDSPFTDADIQQIIGLLEGSIEATRSQRNNAVRAFGEKLFNTVFSGQIYAAYLASQERAEGVGLRIKLLLDNAGALADIPFELLRDPRSDYLALSRQTPIIRYPRVMTTRPLVAVSLPLRVLVMISSPKDQEPLDVESEWRVLQEATADLRNRGLLHLERMEDAQLITLQRKLREGADYQVFHYIGHAAFDERSQSGLLAFENPRTGETAPVSGEALARELSEENSIRLVVLNACQGARENRTDPFAGIASSIVARGLPAVVAMQFTIDDNASRIFSQEFYKVICEGYPIETAMAEARRSMSSGLNDFQWATPVLYLRAPSGILFPRRKRQDKASSGGLREALRSPIGLLLTFVTLAIIIIAVVLLLNHAPLPINRDVDLAITSLRFSPPNPLPGQHVTVAMVIKNNGTTDSGSFNWAWYAGNIEENTPATITGKVPNLGPGASLNVKGDYYFGLWDTYPTAAWVNFDNQVIETNIVNNFLIKSVTVADKPMVIDFTRLPSGDALLENTPLKGDEFKAWGLQIALGPGASPECTGAAVQLEVEDNVNRLKPGLTDNKDKCTNLPIVFTLDQTIGHASIDFVPRVPGKYTLDLFDETGKNIGTNSVTITGTGQLSTIQSPEGDPLPDNVKQIMFSGPNNGTVEIQTASFALSTEDLATPAK